MPNFFKQTGPDCYQVRWALKSRLQPRYTLHAHRGLDDNTFRTYIGLEDPEDLITDLEKGLAAWWATMD